VNVVRALAAVGSLFLAAAGCRPAPGHAANQLDSAALAQRAVRLAETLAHPDSGADRSKPLSRWLMPLTLTEISGLALTNDQRLFAHDDELARLSEIDFRRGVVLKLFTLGQPAVRADFEAIAIANDVFFLLASNGDLYEFREGADEESVPYSKHDTHLGRDCEFEAMAYDPAINSLVMACKHVHQQKLQGSVVLYRWRLDGSKASRLSQLTVPLAKVIGSNGWKAFHTSDMTLDPLNGNYVLIASLEKAIAEITPAGEVVFSRPLPGNHDQPEGIAITRDSILMISDEAARRPAAITLYRWP
jgi:uncharacterized protein YjiK